MNQLSTITLSSKGLTIGYSQKKNPIVVLSELNITINSPKLICIIGKNGTGKSTLLRTLARLQPPLMGSVYLSNLEINSIENTDWARNISVVLTDMPFDSLFSSYDIIAMGRQVHTNWIDKLSENDKTKIDFAIDITKVHDLLSKKFFELSDGQKQKVMLTRALAQDTAIIMLDEPTVHLDVNHSMEMFLLFQKLVKEHQKIVLLTSHEIGLSMQLADEIWLIDKGKLYIDSKENILKEKLISKAFDTDLIRFCPEQNSFVYK